MSKKILIVEDDVVLHKALIEFLETQNFEVAGALDGERGIEMAKSEKPDIILLDIVLPKKDGFAVITEIKADENTKNIPIVLLTNLGGISEVQKALELGATTYLVKADYKMEDIARKIESILGA